MKKKVTSALALCLLLLSSINITSNAAEEQPGGKWKALNLDQWGRTPYQCQPQTDPNCWPVWAWTYNPYIIP